ncbi:hypothetical protein C6N75_07025 [Streptomyces solincola]|uniref:Secreted protein n=1 Tax=Streptomyces solincola TaxID=2100817 RepID=A0A2S9PZU0_9ACTN|nr:hypothetical protein [Streptomyces solincola]PRH79908.1 hypothetical protein C6N75_07025 [Streptomyces solincola]
MKSTRAMAVVVTLAGVTLLGAGVNAMAHDRGVPGSTTPKVQAAPTETPKDVAIDPTDLVIEAPVEEAPTEHRTDLVLDNLVWDTIPSWPTGDPEHILRIANDPGVEPGGKYFLWDDVENTRGGQFLIGSDVERPYVGDWKAAQFQAAGDSVQVRYGDPKKPTEAKTIASYKKAPVS